jgi:cobaltochelatase CobN
MSKNSSSPSGHIRILVVAATAEDPAWVAWQPARDASPHAQRMALQRVSRSAGRDIRAAVALGYGESLHWFGPVEDDATRNRVIGYAEQVLAAGVFPEPGPELRALLHRPAGAANSLRAPDGAADPVRERVGAANSLQALDGTAGPPGVQVGAGGDVCSGSHPAREIAPRVVLLSHAETDLLALDRAREELPAGFPSVTSASLNGVSGSSQLSDLCGARRGAKLAVIVRVHGAAASVPGLIDLIAQADRDDWHVIVISGVGADAAIQPRSARVPAELAADLTAYFMAGGVANVAQALRRVVHELLEIPTEFQPPRPMPAHGLYHPDLLVTSVAEWQSYHPGDRQVAVVLFYRAHVLSGNLQFVDQLVRALESGGLAAVGVFTSSLRERDASGMPVALQVLPPPAVIVNTVSYPMLTLTSLESPPPAEAAGGAFAAIGAPLIQAICCGSTRAAWQESARGLSPAEAAMNVALPECDGRVITVPISFKENHRYVPDSERIGRVADIARRLVVLRTRSNSSKRIAIVLGNSGGKAQKVGSAVGLDTPASLFRWLRDMANRGYTVGELPQSPDELLATLLAGGSYDEKSPMDPGVAWRMPRADYVRWFRQQSPGLQRSMRASWGEPAIAGATAAPPFWRGGKQSSTAPLLALHEPHTDHDNYLFNGRLFGNVLVAIQPPRGFGFDQETMYHSPDLPPCHHYAAFYRWLADVWGTDAIIHFGTHGTLEWLPGKSLALSPDCAPDALLADIPLFYPFVINNPGEGAQAKRRSHAVIVDHLVPPLTQADSYGPLAALARLVEEYYRAESLDPDKLTVLRAQIWNLVRAERLEDDLRQIRRERHADHVHSWDERITEQGVPRGLETLSGRGFAHLLEDLDAYLCDLGRAQIRGGLHVFGVAPTGSALVDLMFAVLYSPNGGIPSLVESVMRACGIDSAALREARGVWTGPVVPALAFESAEAVTAGQVRAAVDRLGRGLLEKLAQSEFAVDVVDGVIAEQFRRYESAAGEACVAGAAGAAGVAGVAGVAGAADVASAARVAGDAGLYGERGTAAATCDLRTTLRFACEVLAPNLARTTDETENLLAGLEGRYVPAGPSGAPSRGMAHVLPTGRNFYTVDPRGLPTPAAWTTGMGLARESLRRFFEEKGRWPEGVALSVWGTPTMRTGGDEISQALAFLGVRPVWEPVTRRTCGIEVIPLAELEWPRIDVTLRVSGFFRDAFPALMHLFDEAVHRVIMLEESGEHNYVRKHWLAETAALAERGSDSEEAATRAAYRVFSSKPGAYGTGILDRIESRSWDETSDLAEVMLAWGGWAYGAGPAAEGVAASENYRQRLAGVELAVQNQDNREQDLFDSADFFEFHGGLVAAVTAAAGERPAAYVGDSSDPAHPQVRTLQGEALRVFRSRVVNPKWLAALQRHGYRGGLEMAATVDALFGFAATAGIVSDWMFEAVAEKFVLGAGRKFLEGFNPWALNAITERLLEAEQRRLWAAKPQTLDALRSVLLMSETVIEEHAEGHN